jgi:hypothetical protein
MQTGIIDVEDRQANPCFLAIDKRGRVRGRYRFARLAVLEASEKGWDLVMEGLEHDEDEQI